MQKNIYISAYCLDQIPCSPSRQALQEAGSCSPRTQPLAHKGSAASCQHVSKLPTAPFSRSLGLHSSAHPECPATNLALINTALVFLTHLHLLFPICCLRLPRNRELFRCSNHLLLHLSCQARRGAASRLQLRRCHNTANKY